MILRSLLWHPIRKHYHCRVLTGWRLVCLTALLLFFLASPLLPHLMAFPAFAGTGPDSNVLVINSYHSGNSRSDNEMNGIIDTFRNAPRHIELRSEYLDTMFFPGTDLFQEQKKLMARKYKGCNIPVVIVADKPAFNFVLKYRDELFPGAAVVFCGINGYEPAMIKGHPRVTGVAERLDTQATVTAALNLHPDTTGIFVVHDYTATGLATRREAELDLKNFTGRIRIRYMGNLGTEEMLREIQTLRKGTLVLVLSYSRDKDGIVYDQPRIARLLAENSSVPVYSTHEEMISHGIVGGCLMGGYIQGSSAADIALRILRGEDPDLINVLTRSPSRMMFDYRQMDKFGIHRGDLPPGTIIVNEPQSFYKDHLGFILSVAGAIISMILIICLLVVNISQRRSSELAIARKAAELEHTNLELQEFNVLSYHDLQEPLRAISSFVQLLERKYRDMLDQEGREYIGFVVQGVSRMKELFGDFLAYTGQKRDETSMVELELELTLTAVLRDLREEIAANRARITSDPLPAVRGNEQQLQLLFRHLIENAIKFRGEEPPIIRIGAQSKEDDVFITIMDNGIGIDPAYHTRIFRIFERLHRQEHYPGTGIGLALCRKIVALHDGEIWVESLQDEGTTFHFSLKRARLTNR